MPTTIPFFDDRNSNDPYARLKAQAAINYASNDNFKRLLLDKIDYLKRLNEQYAEKESINQAFAILDDVARKDFSNLNFKLTELQKTANKDVRSFSVVKSFLSLILLPLLFPLLMLESIAMIVVAYQYMVLVQIALLALAISLTLAFLNPVVLLATIPAALILGHILSELVLTSVMEQIISNIGLVFQSLFYEEDIQLKNGLDSIMYMAKEAQKQDSSSAGFFSWFRSRPAEPSIQPMPEPTTPAYA